MRAEHLTTTLLSVAMLATATGCQPHPSDTREASADPNKALVRRWIDEGFNRHNLAVVDELFAERVAINGQIVGREALKQGMNRHLDGFPDLHVTIDDIVAEGRNVGVWYTVEGTHRGEFEAVPPTGNRVKWVGVDLFGLDGGRIVEARFLSDVHGLLAQLGATVPAPQAPARSRP
jgi:steroid delta-isomerase-like uncharacterized protein